MDLYYKLSRHRYRLAQLIKILLLVVCLKMFFSFVNFGQITRYIKTRHSYKDIKNADAASNSKILVKNWMETNNSPKDKNFASSKCKILVENQTVVDFFNTSYSPKIDKDIADDWSDVKYFLNSSKPAPIDHHGINFPMEPKDICNEKFQVIMMIYSFVEYGERRNVIRSTIGNHFKHATRTFKMVFIVGTSKNGSNVQLIKEQSEYNDILMINTVDDYRNLTYKAVGWLKWINKSCKILPQHFIKMDDDAVVNLPAIVDLLKPCLTDGKDDPMCTEISCNLRIRYPTLRWGKNIVTSDEYPFESYPPFCQGLLYVIPANLVHRMFKAAQIVPFIWLEDIYFSVYLRMFIGGKINEWSKYYIQNVEEGYEKLCEDKLVGHFRSESFVEDYSNMWIEILKRNKEFGITLRV